MKKTLSEQAIKLLSAILFLSFLWLTPVLAWQNQTWYNCAQEAGYWDANSNQCITPVFDSDGCWVSPDASVTGSNRYAISHFTLGSCSAGQTGEKLYVTYQDAAPPCAKTPPQFVEDSCTISPEPVSVTVDNSCSAGGNWTLNPLGTTGSASQTITFAGDPNGALYTLSYTPLANYTGEVSSPSSQMMYPGGSYSFTTSCEGLSVLITSFTASPNPYSCTTGTTLSWTSENATSCSATSPSGWTSSTATSGSQNVTPSGTTTYSITCTGFGDSDTESVQVSAPADSCSPSSVSLSANPATISAGQSSTLTWSGENVTSCSAWWTGSTATSGSQSVSPSLTTTYAISCDTTSGGTVTNEVDVTVSAPGPSVSVTASPATITSGGSSLISWNASNATSCSATSPSGWTSSTAVSGSQTVSPTQTTTYVMTCTGSGGSGQGSAALTVNPPEGQTSGISVSTNNSSSSWTINPGSLSGSGTGGSYTVTPDSGGTTYTITASDISGFSKTITNSDGGGSSLVLSPSQSKSFSVTYSGSGFSFDYSLSNGGPVSVIKSSSDVFATELITRTAISGTQNPVSLSVSGLPSGVSAAISSNPCAATCNSTITLTVSPTASTGTFTVTVTGTATDGPTRTTQFQLTVNPPSSFSVSCSPNPSPGVVGQPVVWSATVSGGTPPYTYSWNGTNFPTSPAPSTNPFNFTYQTTGSKTAQATVRDQGGAGAPTTCPTVQLQVEVKPKIQEF